MRASLRLLLFLVVGIGFMSGCKKEIKQNTNTGPLYNFTVWTNDTTCFYGVTVTFDKGTSYAQTATIYGSSLASLTCPDTIVGHNFKVSAGAHTLFASEVSGSETWSASYNLTGSDSCSCVRLKK